LNEISIKRKKYQAFHDRRDESTKEVLDKSRIREEMTKEMIQRNHDFVVSKRPKVNLEQDLLEVLTNHPLFESKAMSCYIFPQNINSQDN